MASIAQGYISRATGADWKPEHRKVKTMPRHAPNMNVDRMEKLLFEERTVFATLLVPEMLALFRSSPSWFSREVGTEREKALIQIERKKTRRQPRAGIPYKAPISNMKLCGSAINSLAVGRI